VKYFRFFHSLILSKDYCNHRSNKFFPKKVMRKNSRNEEVEERVRILLSLRGVLNYSWWQLDQQVFHRPRDQMWLCLLYKGKSSESGEPASEHSVSDAYKALSQAFNGTPNRIRYVVHPNWCLKRDPPGYWEWLNHQKQDHWSHNWTSQFKQMEVEIIPEI